PGPVIVVPIGPGAVVLNTPGPVIAVPTGTGVVVLNTPGAVFAVPIAMPTVAGVKIGSGTVPGPLNTSPGAENGRGDPDPGAGFPAVTAPVVVGAANAVGAGTPAAAFSAAFRWVTSSGSPSAKICPLMTLTFTPPVKSAGPAKKSAATDPSERNAITR